MRATLYMRVGCHWCGEAYEALRDAGYEVDEVSVEDSDDLEAKYGERVPVIVVDGRILAEGPVSPAAVAAMSPPAERADT